MSAGVSFGRADIPHNNVARDRLSDIRIVDDDGRCRQRNVAGKEQQRNSDHALHDDTFNEPHT
jgi:hypothetical protein